MYGAFVGPVMVRSTENEFASHYVKRLFASASLFDRQCIFPRSLTTILIVSLGGKERLNQAFFIRTGSTQMSLHTCFQNASRRLFSDASRQTTFVNGKQALLLSMRQRPIRRSMATASAESQHKVGGDFPGTTNYI